MSCFLSSVLSSECEVQCMCVGGGGGGVCGGSTVREPSIGTVYMYTCR